MGRGGEGVETANGEYQILVKTEDLSRAGVGLWLMAVLDTNNAQRENMWPGQLPGTSLTLF